MRQTMRQTMKEMAWHALNARGTTYLPAVINQFNIVSAELHGLGEQMNMGTGWAKEHPISKVFAERIAMLAGLGSHIDLDDVRAAVNAVMAITEQGDKK